MPARAAHCSYCAAPVNHAPTAAALSELGSRVEELTGGAFAVDRLIGCGPHGCTFRALVADTGAAVALKFVRLAAGLADETARLLAESLAAAAAVGHPRILAASPLQRAGSDAVCWTTPLVPDGVGVDRLLGAAEPPTLRAVSRILVDVAGALDAAQAHGVPHLALMPSKVILDRTGHGYVADLGVALGFRSGLSLSGPGAAERAAYAAPEQWHGEPADGRADQYALAVMTYELLTGKRRGEMDAVGAMALLPPLEVTPDSPLRRGVPLHVNTALLRALGKRPEHRFASTGDFVEAAVGKVDTTPVSMPTVHPVLDIPQRRRGWLLPVVTTAVLLLGGAALFGPWSFKAGPLARSASVEAQRATARRAAEAARPGQPSGGGGGGGDAAGDASATPVVGGVVASEPAYIRVTAGGRSALVIVDGTPRGVAPLTVRVAPGSHTVALRGTGFGSGTRTVTASAGGTVSADFTPASP
ncbi:MAG: serine/threonine protein kinase [Gemmatimonadaceae bacterium]